MEGNNAPATPPSPPEGEIVRLTVELAEMKERWLRARADYENLLRRTAREKEEIRRTAASTLLETLVPTYETLQAAAAADDGQRRVFEQFRDALEGHGFAAIEDEGLSFDPQRHEAVERVESPLPEGTVLETVARGYALNGVVLRPARVKVAGSPTH